MHLITAFYNSTSLIYSNKLLSDISVQNKEVIRGSSTTISCIVTRTDPIIQAIKITWRTDKGLVGNENGISVNKQNKKSTLTIQSVEHDETFTCEVNPTDNMQALREVTVSVYSK